jgi:hypothetical protein
MARGRRAVERWFLRASWRAGVTPSEVLSMSACDVLALIRQRLP